MEPIYLPSWWDVHNDRLSHVSTQQTYSTHGSGRALFGDWGRLGNVHAFTENGNLKLNFMFDGSVKYVNMAIPYYFEDNVTIYEADVKINPHLFIAEREMTLNKCRHLRQITNKGVKDKNKKLCQSYITSVNNGTSIKKLAKKASISVPISVIYATENYIELLSPEKYTEACKTSSSMYSGGCIKTFSLQDEIFIARCVGVHLGSLRIDKYNGTITQVYPTSDDAPMFENSPIFEIDCSNINNECRLLIRRADQLQLLSAKINGDQLSVIDIGRIPADQMLPWLCGKLNTWWNGELVVTSADGISLYETDTMTPHWKMKTPALSPVIDSWSEMRSLLPMQWVHATRSECSLIDCRSNPFVASKPLFSITHPSLNSKESFCHLSSLFDTHYFHLFSSYSGHLLDFRMPGRQVSQWSVPLLNPVSYSSVAVVENSVQFVLGAQMDSRHCIFDVSTTNKCKSTALASQAIVGPSAMSLGVAVIQDDGHQGSVTVLTLNHRGKVLCHRYNRDQLPTTADNCGYANIYEYVEPGPIDERCDYEILSEFDPDTDIIIKEQSPDKQAMELASVKQWLMTDINKTRYKNSDVFNL